MHALIVEDTYINQEFLKMILEGHGKCTVVESGEAAIDAFTGAMDNEPFDLIFMDIMLPGMDGLQALEHIRNVEARQGVTPERQAKAIITTALDDDSKASRAYIHGQAISYITKPIREEVVQEELKKFGFIN